MMERRLIRKEQLETLNQDLATIVASMRDITTFLNACYGNKDACVWRAEEVQAALQRLLWALERQGRPLAVGNAAGSSRV